MSFKCERYLQVAALRLLRADPKGKLNFVTWQRCKHRTLKNSQTGSQVGVSSGSKIFGARSRCRSR